MDRAIADVAGIHGTELAPEVVARLPPTAPAAPWRLRGSGLAWVAPATRAAGAALQPGIAGRPLAVGGMLISYQQTPVGPYDEVIGFVALRRGWAPVGHVPFIAVDDAASVVGGRANWALPKALATFSGNPRHEPSMRARHEAWEVTARARALGPPLPARARFTLVQAADGRELRFGGRARLRTRPALMQVATAGVPELTGWLRCGRYPGLIIERFDVDFGESAIG
jgi:acetoacetate decarboxylase